MHRPGPTRGVRGLHAADGRAEREKPHGEGGTRDDDLVDCMPVREQYPRVVRVVEGVRGTVPMAMSLQVRFDYGRVRPWVQRTDHRIAGVAGPDAVEIAYDVPLVAEGPPGMVNFVVAEGQKAQFVFSWYPSHLPPPAPGDAARMLADTEALWQQWSGRSTYDGLWPDEVMRSLVTLKASHLRAHRRHPRRSRRPRCRSASGGVRNWDYRYCWVRDAAPDARCAAPAPATLAEAKSMARLAAQGGRRRSRRPVADHVRPGR